MRDRLVQLIDRPVTIRTVQERPSGEPIQGVVFEVGAETVDVLLAPGILKTVRIAMIVDVVLETFLARQMVLDDPPPHEDYPRAKRRLLEAEQLVNLAQPPSAVAARAAEAAALFRNVRAAFPHHRGVAERLARAHFLATGRHDFEEPRPEVTSGELDDEDFRAARVRLEKLEAALRARRPEEEVAVLLPPVARHAGRALVRYPNHADLRAWFARAEAVRAKLSERTRRFSDLGRPFVPGET